jgi:transposase
VKDWLVKHPRFVMHFTPTGSSWLNMMERFFRDISKKRIKRDNFTSVLEMELTIHLCVAHQKRESKAVQLEC